MQFKIFIYNFHSHMSYFSRIIATSFQVLLILWVTVFRDDSLPWSYQISVSDIF